MEALLDDTIAIIKCGSEEYILNVLNSFSTKIQFTYEEEVDGKLSFLDVLLVRNQSDIQTKVYRKKTNTDLYLHWKSFAPISWKRGTIKSLYNRAHIVCSSSSFLSEEIAHLDKVFNERNGYPKWLIEKVKKECVDKFASSNTPSVAEPTTEINQEPSVETKEKLLIIPFAGETGISVTNKLKKEIATILPRTIKPKIIFTGQPLLRTTYEGMDDDWDR